MRHHPFALFALAAVVLTVGYAMNSTTGPAAPTTKAERARARADARADARTALQRERRNHPKQRTDPQADRVLARNPFATAEAKPGEAQAAVRTTGDRNEETTQQVKAFAGDAFVVAVVAGIGWVILQALMGPVRWRQRRG